jgi:hypothetical protein
MEKRCALLCCLFVALATTAFAQDKPVVKTPMVDGVVKTGEYVKTLDFSPFTLSVTRAKDAVFFAVSVKTTGWVALAVGSDRMDSATMFLGNVVDGKAGFTEQSGRGHGHTDAAADKIITVRNAVQETAGVTTLEVECKASVIPAGTKEISLLLAYADDDSFRARHAVRKAVTVKFE